MLQIMAQARVMGLTKRLSSDFVKGFRTTPVRRPPAGKRF
jgi:hypothetical protein